MKKKPPIKIPWPSLPEFPEPYNEKQKLVRKLKYLNAAIKKADKCALMAIAFLNVGLLSEDAAVEFISEATLVLEELVKHHEKS